MCVNSGISVGNGLVFWPSQVPLLTGFLLMSSNCRRKNNLFSVLHLNNTGTRGLICVPLTGRKRVKRHSETIKRERERCRPELGRWNTCTRDNLLSVISLCFLAIAVVLHHLDKPSDDPASSPDPL